MRELLANVTEYTTLLIDSLALLVILIGTLEAAFNGARAVVSSASNHQQRDVWLRYARWLVVGLTFQLAADVVETSISTDWASIGRLAAIAVIRTFLNYFLERDLAEVRERQHEAERRST